MNEASFAELRKHVPEKHSGRARDPENVSNETNGKDKKPPSVLAQLAQRAIDGNWQAE